MAARRVRPTPLLAALVGLSVIPVATAKPLNVTVHQIKNFALTASGETGGRETAGRLEFLGGLDVSADDRFFGGLSGIDMLDGETAFMISDSGAFVRARLVRESGRLVGLADAEIDSLFPDGDMSKEFGDAEDVALHPADRTHGVIVRERQPNALLTFDIKGDRPTSFEPKFVGADDRILTSNKGLESVAYAPATSPIAGEIITIAEHPPVGGEDIPGWVAGVGGFTIVRHDDFDVSSARFLPNGDLILLERRYSPAWGIAVRLRLIAGNTIKVGGRLDGEILLDAGMTSQIDNMEGLAVQLDEAGRTVLTLVSDDNYSVLQRTLILQFALTDD